MNKRILVFGLLWIFLPLTACFPLTTPTPTVNFKQQDPLIISTIPDPDSEKQKRLFEKLVAYLETQLGIPVKYQLLPNAVTTITAFQLGAVELVWFDGLTGVQARVNVSGADAIIQRDIDEQFYSLFIANQESQLTPFDDLTELIKLKGKTFTFSGQFSTSGRLMPQYFLYQAGVKLEDFRGQPGFSENSNQTIQQVETGIYEVGVVQEAVWQQEVNTNKINLEKVSVIWRTPAYPNYHWVIHPKTQKKYGQDFFQQVQQAFLNLDPSIPEEKEILDLFEAQQFIPTENSNYEVIEKIARELNKIQ